jgi:sulfite exporter TauE/SafE
MLTSKADVVALFMLGFLGTGHCIGMCGPLVVALPGQTGRFSAHLAYHAGRLMTYGIIGSLMGLAGKGMIRISLQFGGSPLLWMSRCQMALGFVAGFFLLLFGLFRLGYLTEPDWLAVASPNRLPCWKRLTGRNAGSQSNANLFLMGLVLGNLPCGLSYAAFAKALAEANMLSGALLAFVFGLGTLPGMLAVGAGSGLLLNRYRRQADLVAGLIMLGMAAILFVQGFEALL